MAERLSRRTVIILCIVGVLATAFLLWAGLTGLGGAV